MKLIARTHPSPRLFLLILLSLAACGGLPRPFEGNPGANALRLAAPPPARLAVPPPSAGVLPDAQATLFAAALADALAAQDVPAVAEPAREGDWRLAIATEPRGGMVVPLYTIEDPAGTEQGSTEGLPIASASWTEAAPATLKQAAADAAPRLAALLTSIEAARHESNPSSLANHLTRLAFRGVTGAPGDGNQSLARQMRSELAKLGEVVQDTDAGADFVLAGAVTTTPTANGQMRVEIQWIVDDASGAERGKVVQLNEIPGGTLDHYWGDVAVVVAHEAAGGVRDVILNQTGAKR
jgi:hypothetical protein